MLATGSFGAEWDTKNFNQFDKLSVFEQTAIKNSLLGKVSTDKKSQQIASQVINASRGR
jgi:hypothetical protein